MKSRWNQKAGTGRRERYDDRQGGKDFYFFLFSLSCLPSDLITFIHINTHLHPNMHAHTYDDKDYSTLKKISRQSPVEDVKGVENQPTGTDCEEDDLKMELEDMAKEKQQVGC